ncbi:MAG: hypothetical protein R2827_03540 [Bdellovibrionales bacterium]
MKFFSDVFKKPNNQKIYIDSLSKYREALNNDSSAKKEILEGLLPQLTPLVTPRTSSSDINIQRLVGLIHFHLGDYKKSVEINTELSEASNSPRDWFNLMAAALLGELFTVGDEAYSKGLEALKNRETNEQMNAAGFKFHYGRINLDAHRPKAAFEALLDLSETYKNRHITDYHFLRVRGLPDFEEFLKLFIESIVQTGQQSQLQTLLDGIRSEVDEEGKISVDRALAEHKTQ